MDIQALSPEKKIISYINKKSVEFNLKISNKELSNFIKSRQILKYENTKEVFLEEILKKIKNEINSIEITLQISNNFENQKNLIENKSIFKYFYS